MVEQDDQNPDEWLYDAFEDERVEIFLKGDRDSDTGIVGKILGVGYGFITLDVFIDNTTPKIFIGGKTYSRENNIHIAISDISTIRVIKE